MSLKPHPCNKYLIYFLISCFPHNFPTTFDVSLLLFFPSCPLVLHSHSPLLSHITNTRQAGVEHKLEKDLEKSTNV